MSTEVKSCGCRYITRDIKEELKCMNPYEIQIAEYLCQDHEKQFIIDTFNHGIIAKHISEYDRKKMMVS